MCENVSSVIKGRQTAYIKGRLINDNIRAMLATVNCANVDELAKGLMISLDAKKAFDSVEHSYIERCLKEFGCARFVPIFKTLYSELSTDIIINGKVVKGFRILRGVKQGDALSCIIFIICMEPLLRNIEVNESIEAINTDALGHLPKVYAYADDVNCTIKDSRECLEGVFLEYERLSRRSGLVLNADKTEIMRLGTNQECSYNATYLNKLYTVQTKASIKINGIVFQRDYVEMVNTNVRNALDRMDSHFKAWSRRSLSTLGRILIVKTFGISQLVYLMQTVELKTSHYKLINNMAYKFIWNRHYLAAKAPERLKREIMCTPVKLGGFGMLDVAALDESLKIKSVGRMENSSHPFVAILRDKSSLENYFYPSCAVEVEPFHIRSLELLRKLRDLTWDCRLVERNRSLLAAVRDISITRLLTREGRMSLAFFNLRIQGKIKIGDLSNGDFGSIRRFIEARKGNLIDRALVPSPAPLGNINLSVKIRDSFKTISKCTSKEIRESSAVAEPIKDFKLGTTMTVSEALNWGSRLNKLTSTKHRNILLRVAHGEFYTKLKLQRFNLIDNSSCPRCGHIEDLRHKFVECAYVKRIWNCSNLY